MIVITGGAGFIGSNLVAALSDQGTGDLVVCDVLGSGEKWRNLAKHEIRDIVQPDDLFPYLYDHTDDIDGVFHIGAISSTTETDADLIVGTNFSLSRRLWKWCASHEKRFIYASSAATYGDGAQGFIDYDDSANLSTLRPLNAYGWSKHLFDRRIARVVAKKSEPIPTQWVGLKFFNAYGPNEYHKNDQMSVVTKLVPQVSAGAAARLFKSYSDKYPDGGQLRDFIYVRDCVNIMLWLWRNPQVNGIYNVGSGQARSFNDLAHAVFSAIGKPPKIQYMDMPETLKAKYQYFTEADMGKLRAAGYDQPLTNLEDGVRDYVHSYLLKEDKFR